MHDLRYVVYLNLARSSYIEQQVWNDLLRFTFSFTPSLTPLTPRDLLVSLPVYDTHDIFPRLFHLYARVSFV